MTGDRDRIVVVRAWRDGDRMVVRVLAGRGDASESDEWVYGRAEDACRRVGHVLAELTESVGPDEPDTKR